MAKRKLAAPANRRSGPGKSPNSLRGDARTERDAELETLARDAYDAFQWQRWREDARRRARHWPASNWLASYVEMIGEVASCPLPASEATEIAIKAESRLLAAKVAGGSDADATLVFAETWVDRIAPSEGTAASLRALGCTTEGKLGWLGFTYEQLSQKPKLAARRAGMTVVRHREKMRVANIAHARRIVEQVRALATKP